MNKSRTHYSVLNIVAGFAGYFLNVLIGYICRMVFARCLNDDYLGANSLFSSLLSMLSLAELGIGGAIGYALYKPLAEDNHEKIASLMQFFKKAYIAIGIVVGLAGLAMMPFLSSIITTPPNIKENIYAIYLFFLFNTASSYFFSYKGTLIIAAQENYLVCGISYISTIVQSLIQIPLLLLTRNYILYLTVQLVCTFMANFCISKVADKQFPYILSNDIQPLSKQELKALFINVKALTINKISQLLVNSTDSIVITYLRGLALTGKVSNYTLLVNTLNSLITQLFTGLTASVGNLNAVESDEKKYSFFKALNLSNFWIFSWGTVGIALVSSDLVQLCFGDNYLLDWKIPLVLALNFYIVGMQNAIYTYKNTMGLFRYGQYLLLLTAAINLILDFALGIRFGALGIFLASTIARLCTNTWYEPYAVFRCGLHLPFRHYVKTYLNYFFVLLLSGTASLIVCSWCHFSLAINVVLKVFICSVVVNGIVIGVYGRTEEGRYLRRMVLNIWHRVKEILI